MAKYIRFGKGKALYAEDMIKCIQVDDTGSGEYWVSIFLLGDGCSVNIPIGYYPSREAAEAAVIHAIEMPGTVGVVPYKEMEV